MNDERKTYQARSMPGAFRSDDGGSEPYIEGYFSVFDDVYEMWPGATESIARGAFDGQTDGDVRALIDHDTGKVLGRTKAGTLQLRTDEHGLWGRVKINPKDTDAMNLYERVRRGDVDQCSFGFEILDESTQFRDDGSVHWIVNKVRLHEVSVCTFPAYESTSVSARRRDYDTIRRRQADTWKNTMIGRIKKYGT